MEKMRIPLWIALGVAALGIVLGSFLDLRLSTAIASRTNLFGITISVIGPTLGFMGLAIIGGGFLGLGLKKDCKVLPRVALIALAVLSYAASVFYAGEEYFNSHGFAGKAPEFVGFLIAAVPLGGGVFLGYKLFHATDNPNAWIILLIMVIVIFLTLVPGAAVLKSIFHRPRFRSVIEYEHIVFHPWWSPCKNYKDLMAEYSLDIEEFKSFPSGHTTEASILIVLSVFMPLVNRKLEKIQLGCFIGACCFAALIGFARILAAAHFLSDVSAGAALALLFTIIANEVVIHAKKLRPSEVEA